jgi:hypothetical protein
MDVCGEASEGAIAKLAVFLSLLSPRQKRESRIRRRKKRKKESFAFLSSRLAVFVLFTPTCDLSSSSVKRHHSTPYPSSASKSLTTASYASAPHCRLSCSTWRIAARSAAEAQLVVEGRGREDEGEGGGCCAESMEGCEAG